MEINLNSNEYVEIRFKPQGVAGRQAGELQAQPKVTVASGGATIEPLEGEEGYGVRVIPGNAQGDVVLNVEGSYVPAVEIAKEQVILRVGVPGSGAGGRETKGATSALGMMASKPSALKADKLAIQKTADAARSLGPEDKAALRARRTTQIEADHIRAEQAKEADARQDPTEATRLSNLEAATRKREREHVEREAARLGVAVPSASDEEGERTKKAKQ